jgi:CHAT domain-containing protein/tetratricopeptide (TPR) repeat protein
VQGFSSAQLPFFLRYRNHSTHCRATLHFSFLRIGPWHPSVSPGLQVRAVLKLTPIPLSSSITVLIADIDGFIAIAQNSLALYPRSHSEHITSVCYLAQMRWERYLLTGEKDDLDRSILHCTEAILLPPVSWDGLLNNVFQLLLHIAGTLLVRSAEFEQHGGVKSSIGYLRYLRGLLPLDSFDVPRNLVTTSLIGGLSLQVRFEEAGDGTQNIQEMVVLCRELLTSTSLADFEVVFTSLNEAVDAELYRGRVQLVDQNQVIECLRDAAAMCQCPPDSHLVFFELASALRTRFMVTHSNDDYEEATALLERILDHNQPGECPDQMRDQASFLVTKLAFIRSAFFKNPQYSQESISRLRTSLSSPSIDEGHRILFTGNLVREVRKRSEYYSLAESLEEANSYTSQLVDLSSSQSLEESGKLSPVDAIRKSYSMTRIAEEIHHLEGLLSTTPPGTYRHNECLSDLAGWYKSKSYRTNDILDIEESIKYSRLSLDATHYSSDLRRFPLCSLHCTLFLAFEKTSKISYLDESITVGYDILELKSARHLHFITIQRLVLSLLSRQQLLGGREDHHEAIRLMSMVVDDQYVREPDRFRLSCEWAILARTISHPTTLPAYKCAMSLMQQSLSFAPTLSIQHTRLVAMDENCQTMPLDFASFQIDMGRFEEAVETLEQGRALLWSEMRGLRAPVAQLIEDSPLTKRFAEINQELEVLTISVTPSGRPEMEDSITQGKDGMDPFGRLVVKQQNLVEERDALVLQIQGRPGLEGFLKAPSYTALCSAASRGPVIIINHCEWRSDILIILHNSLPCSIPTAKGFYARANKLRDELVGARKHGLDSGKYQDVLCSVLKGLYELVGEPVIERLRVLGVPEQSRIWLCPTSVFCSLPLHAMGPIPSNDACERYFSDLYIPSYTPSLSALIESRKASPQMLDKPSLLLVAQPDDSLPGVDGEIKVIQRALKGRVTVTGLVSSEATPSSVVEGLRGSQFAHFACHGVLETGKPFEASFKLHGGSRLTLLEIVRSHLPDAEFAFLSCCHTAEITNESIPDEALHLTAAMQYCGFRSVVGTMWEMADTDGRDLAKSFYESLFSSQETGVPYYERSARALRNATRKLRKKRGITLERWVNFVHYGA